jgi:hypothetical protein
MRAKNTLAIILLLAATMDLSCNKRDRAWEDAKETNTVAGYRAYEKSHPESPHSREAAEAIRSLKWEQATEGRSAAAVEAYISEYPDAANIDQAHAVLEGYSYDVEIGALNECVKAFLNGDVKSNRISSLNGVAFAEKDQDPHTGMTLFGTLNLRVSETVRNRETGTAISITYQPKPNQMVESVESISPDEGVTITFTNGHQYKYSQGEWKRK